jgi:hypothetical protein
MLSMTPTVMHRKYMQLNDSNSESKSRSETKGPDLSEFQEESSIIAPYLQLVTKEQGGTPTNDIFFSRGRFKRRVFTCELLRKRFAGFWGPLSEQLSYKRLPVSEPGSIVVVPSGQRSLATLAMATLIVQPEFFDPHNDQRTGLRSTL